MVPQGDPQCGGFNLLGEEKEHTKGRVKNSVPHLRYELLDLDHTFPTIVSAKLDDTQLEQLLDVFRK